MRRIVALFSLLVALVPAVAFASPPTNKTAETHYKVGLDHFMKKEYPDAIEELKMAYALDAATDILYAWAQAERLAGNCPGAIKLYTKYLGQSVSPDQQKLASENLAKCAKSVENTPEPDVPPPKIVPPKKEEPKVVVTPPPAQEPTRSPWYTDVLGDVLVGAGAAALVFGSIEFASSSSDADAASSATNYGDYQTNIENAQSKRTIAIVSLAAGGALVVGGIVRYATRSSGARGATTKEVEARVGYSPWVGQGGGGLVVFGRF